MTEAASLASIYIVMAIAERSREGLKARRQSERECERERARERDKRDRGKERERARERERVRDSEIREIEG
jgi:hypothetical protein